MMHIPKLFPRVKPVCQLSTMFAVVVAMLGNPAVAQSDDCSDILVGTTAFSTGAQSHCVFLGAGGAYEEKAYGDSESTAFPLVAILWDIFYWDTDEIGMYFAGDSEGDAYWTMSVMGRYVVAAYEQKDSAILEMYGLQDREDAIEVGLNASLGSRVAGEVQITAAADVSDTHDGYSLELRYLYAVNAGGWRFSPSISVVMLDKKSANYAYGIPEGSGNSGYAGFETDGVINYSLGFSLVKPLFRRWTLFSGADYEILDSKVSDSPIVVHDGMGVVYAGVVYQF